MSHLCHLQVQHTLLADNNDRGPCRYERLEANLPKMLMQHTDFAFPDNEQLFPTHAAITEYLERYTDEVLLPYLQNVINREAHTTFMTGPPSCQVLYPSHISSPTICTSEGLVGHYTFVDEWCP